MSTCVMIWSKVNNLVYFYVEFTLTGIEIIHSTGTQVSYERSRLPTDDKLGVPVHCYFEIPQIRVITQVNQINLF